MSWLKSAVSKAVVLGNKNNLSRAVKSYADSVVQQAGQAVAEGAKILQDRIGNRNFKSVNQAMRRLEEAAVSCRGSERVLLLKRWLIVLKEINKLSRGSSEEEEKSVEQTVSNDEAMDHVKKLAMVLYFDSDIGGEPMNFHDVFLKSQALEGITISMILEAPSEEEVSLLLELFGLCLTGGKEVHIAILSSIQDLATVFVKYQEEVLVKREELLQFAQASITGLKINADLGRLDLEAKNLKRKLDEMTSKMLPSKDQGKASNEATKTTIEALKVALAQIRICAKLEGILLKKKKLSLGDSPETHAQKVDKLKVLSESLANSTVKAEKRTIDHRSQKEEALKVRMSKADEANEKEKEIVAEISVLEKQRDELEAELKKVNISLAAANSRLRNAREERDQFDEANNQIVEHLTTKEDELRKSIGACKVEADIIKTWINFLEDTWVIHQSYAETKDKQVNDELKQHEEHFLNLAIHRLSDYKKELGPSISQIEKFVVNLKKLNEGSDGSYSMDHESSKALDPRKNLEEEYLEYEAKIITTFSVVDNIREHFYSSQGASSRKDDSRVKELFNDIEKLRAQFESIERPVLEFENPIPSPKAAEIASQKQEGTLTESSSSPQKHQAVEQPKALGVEAQQQVLDHGAELAKVESELGKHDQDYSTEEIGDWEFDELERELNAEETARRK